MEWKLAPEDLPPLRRHHPLRWFAVAVLALFALVALEVIAGLTATGIGIALGIGGLGVFALLLILVVAIYVLPGHGERRDGAPPPKA